MEEEYLRQTMNRILRILPLDDTAVNNLNSKITPNNIQNSDDSCPVIHFLNYAWEYCGSIWTWSILEIPLLVIIIVPIGVISAFVILRNGK